MDGSISPSVAAAASPPVAATWSSLSLLPSTLSDEDSQSPPQPQSELQPTSPPAVGSHHAHSFSILIDNAPHAGVGRSSEEQPPQPDEAELMEDEDQPGSPPPSNPASPPAARRRFTAPLSPSSAQSASISFSYRSSDSDEEGYGRDVPSVAPPLLSPALLDRYDAQEPRDGAEAVAVGREQERGREEEERLMEQDEDDDIGRVQHHHTIRQPKAPESMHFQDNPLHVAGMQAAEEEDRRRQAAEAERRRLQREQRLAEKAERRRLRAERRRQKAERAAALQQQLQQRKDEAVLAINDASPPAVRAPSSSNSSVVIDVRDDQQSAALQDVRLDVDEKEAALPPAAASPSASVSGDLVADGKKSLREERRPAKLQIPPRSAAQPQPVVAVEEKAAGSADSGREQTAELHQRSMSQSSAAAGPRRSAQQLKADAVHSKQAAFKTPVKQTLRQLVAVTWLPTEPSFPPTRAARSNDSSGGAGKEKERPLIAAPQLQEGAELLRQRKERAEQAGVEDKGRKPWLSSHKQDTRTEIEDRQPRRFMLEEQLKARQLKGGAELRQERVLGRDAVLRVDRAKESHLYTDVVLLDDGRAVDRPLLDALNGFSRLRSLTINDTKITQTRLQLPQLLSLSLSNNKIASCSTLTHLTQGTPSLSSLTVVNQPINSRLPVDALPPVEHEVWRLVLLPLQTLRWWNGLRIDNKSRFAAFQCAKQPKLSGSVSMSLWTSALDDEPQVSAMPSWTPLSLRSLSLSGMSLLSLHCSPLAACSNLTSLDVSRNHLSSLQHSGLHLLGSLTALDLSENELQHSSDCLLFGHLPRLLSLSLKGNEALKDARLFAIFCCRWLRGVECSPGLRCLDGQVVSLEDKCRAAERFDKAGAAAERWRLLCCRFLTHSEWQSRPQLATVLQLPHRGLQFASTAGMTGLQQLDLSHNSLRYVDGLEALQLLRTVDLSFNLELNVKATLQQLAQLQGLVQVHTLPGDAVPRADHYHRVLAALFPSNPLLRVVDGREVELDDYAQQMRRLGAFHGRDELLSSYRVNLHILADAKVEQTKSWTPQAVQPGVQWQPADIRELQLPSLSLDDSLSVLAFRSLTLLNLQSNRLTSITCLQLPALPCLLWCDLRHNRIRDSQQLLGSVIAQCLRLKGALVSGNPMCQDKGWRQRTIDHVPALITVDCPLQILDSLITIDERVTAYGHALLTAAESSAASPQSPRSPSARSSALALQRQQSSGSLFSSSSPQAPRLSEGDAQRAAQFRFLLCLQYHLPASASFHLVTELILVEQRLSVVDFSGFPLLEKLFLGRNELTTLTGSGLQRCGRLRVLDLRSNRLRELQALISLIAFLPLLEYIGAKDNKWKEGGGAGRQYRDQLILGIVTRLGHSHCIRFIDDSEIGADELLSSLVETGEISSLQEKEIFRFNELCKHKDAALQQLDLSNCKLQAAEFHRFPQLRTLDISRNLFSDEQLLASGLDACTQLSSLNLSDNQLRATPKVASFLAQLPRLASVNVLSNPMTSREERPRRLFLSFYSGLLDPLFGLRLLNGEAVSIEERINAFVLAGSKDKDRHGSAAVGRHRRGISMDGMSPLSPLSPRRSLVGRGSQGSAADLNSPSALSPKAGFSSAVQLLPSPYTDPHLALSNSLHFTAEQARFALTLPTLVKEGDEATVTSLKLKGRKLMFVGGPSGISRFINVRQLDLRCNDMESLDHQTLDALPQLHTLDLRGNRFQSLSGVVSALHRCHQLQVLALHRCTRELQETAVVDRYLDLVFTSLRGLTLCDGYKASNSLQSSPLSLSALSLLHKLAGIGPNELHEVHLQSVRGRKELLPFVLSALYYLQVPRLRLDGNNEWCQAAEYADLVIVLMGKHLAWLDGADVSEERRYLALQVNQRKKLDKERLQWEESWEEAHERVDAFLRERQKQDASQRRPSTEEKGRYFNASIPQVLGVESAGASGSSGILSQSGSALSSILSKAEICVHFLQVYSITLTSDISIPWPHAYLDFSAFTSLFTFDFTHVFSLSSAFAQTLLFALLVAFPSVLLLFFLWFGRLRKQQDYYARQLIDRWSQTRAVALCAFVLSILVSLAVGLLAADSGAGVTALQAGVAPPAESLTVVLLLGCSFSLLFLLWYAIVRTFRSLYMADGSEDKLEFRSKWLSMLNWAQILAMFGLTILFMPISRTLLSQFQCQCDTDAAGESSCHDANYSDAGCFPGSVSAIQVLAVLFGLVFIVGLPLFYLRLINRTVKLVTSTSRLYQQNEEAMRGLREGWAAYCLGWDEDVKGWSEQQRKRMQKERAEHRLSCRRALSELSRRQQLLYYSVVNQPEHTVPASSLYSSFTYRHRYWKIVQMMEKLVLIVIALFVPQQWGALQQAAVVSSGAVILLTTGLVVSARPYNDLLEDVMDGMAGAANTVNALVAISLVYALQWMTSERADIILLLANGATIAAFIIAFTVVPIRAYRHAKLQKQKETKEQEQKDGERKEREEKKKEKKEKDQREKRAQAARAGKGAVAIVSEEEFKRAQSQEQAVSPDGNQQPQPQPQQSQAVETARPAGHRRSMSAAPFLSPSLQHSRVRGDSVGLPAIDERSPAASISDRSEDEAAEASQPREAAVSAASPVQPRRRLHSRDNSFSLSISKLNPSAPQPQQPRSVRASVSHSASRTPALSRRASLEPQPLSPSERQHALYAAGGDVHARSPSVASRSLAHPRSSSVSLSRR